MEYLALLNTFAIILLALETMFYIDTEHKVKSCRFDYKNMFCYQDIHCYHDPATHETHQ